VGQPEPIRVLRLIARMNVGGPALQVVNLTEGLDPARFETRLLIGEVGPEEGDYVKLRAPGLPAVHIPGLGREPHAPNDLGALRRVVREMRDFRPQIVHTHTAKAGVIGRLAARYARVPHTVHTFHGHLLHGYFRPSVTRAVVLTERALARGTDRLVAVGSQVRDELLAARIGRRDQYVVVPPGIRLPPPPARADARRTLGLAADGFVIAFVGRLTTVKRPERVVEVASRLRARGHNVTVVVTGDGDRLEDLRGAAAAAGEDVRFLGWRADVETVYAAADVALLTSDNEGMPVSLIEAALSGCPAVTTDVGSAREVVVDGVTGLVTPVDVDALTAAVERLIGDRSLVARMGRAASERAEKEFSAARLVRDTELLYEELIAP
jgi:glycosyltransferase involved in cell wall biosynthesis